jgi:hypothetical protein
MMVGTSSPALFALGLWGGSLGSRTMQISKMAMKHSIVWVIAFGLVSMVDLAAQTKISGTLTCAKTQSGIHS